MPNVRHAIQSQDMIYMGSWPYDRLEPHEEYACNAITPLTIEGMIEQYSILGL